MARIAFNDAKETAHTASWPLKGLYSSAGMGVGRPPHCWLKSFHSQGRHMRPPSPKSGRSLDQSPPTLVMLVKAHHWATKVFKEEREWERREWGKVTLMPGAMSAGESSPGGASQTLYGKSPNCFLPTRYLYFLLRAWARKHFLSSDH